MSKWSKITRTLLFIFKRKYLRKDTVVIEITKIRLNRRLFQLCSMLTSAGFDCWIKTPVRKILKMDVYGFRTLEMDHVYFYTPNSNREYKIFLSDEDYVEKRKPAYLKRIRINYDVFNTDIVNKEDFFYPILFHPDFHNSLCENRILNSSNSVALKRIGILFAGNVDESHYNRERTKSTYNIHTRWELYDFLCKTIPEELIFRPKSYTELKYAIDNNLCANKLVLADTRVCRITQDNWFDILNEARCFIHMPGYIQPFCHNQVESMACGAIPITQFPGIFLPELENLNTAFVFDELSHLQEIITQLLTGDYELRVIQNMSDAVKRYYVDLLSQGSFEKELTAFLNSLEEAAQYFICAGEFSLELIENRKEV